MLITQWSLEREFHSWEIERKGNFEQGKHVCEIVMNDERMKVIVFCLFWLKFAQFFWKSYHFFLIFQCLVYLLKSKLCNFHSKSFENCCYPFEKKISQMPSLKSINKPHALNTRLPTFTVSLSFPLCSSMWRTFMPSSWKTWSAFAKAPTWCLRVKIIDVRSLVGNCVSMLSSFCSMDRNQRH